MANNFWQRQEDGVLRIELDSTIYSVAACLRAAHELSAKYTIKVDQTADSVTLFVMSLGEKEIGESEASSVLRSVTDHALREQLNRDTAPLRNTILAAAFEKVRLPISERAHEP